MSNQHVHPVFQGILARHFPEPTPQPTPEQIDAAYERIKQSGELQRREDEAALKLQIERGVQ